MQSQEPAKDEYEDNVVPLSVPVGSKNRQIYEHLRQFFEYFSVKNVETEERLESLDSHTRHLDATIQSIGPETVSLRRTSENLTAEMNRNRAESLARLDTLDTRNHKLKITADELISKTAAFRSSTEDLTRELEKTNTDTQARLDTLDSRSRVLEETTEGLSAKTASLASLTEKLSKQLLTTAESQEAAISRLVQHAERAESRLDALDTGSQEHAEALKEFESRTGALERRATEFERADDRLLEDSQVLETRISELEPRNRALEDTSRQLLQDTDAARIRTDGLSHRFKQAAWLAGCSIALLAVATGVTHMSDGQTLDSSGVKLNQQISAIHSELGGELQRLATLQSGVTDRVNQLEFGQSDDGTRLAQLEGGISRLGNLRQIETLQRDMDSIASEVTGSYAEYERLSSDMENLDHRILAMGEQFQSEMSVIKEHIYSGDENLTGTSVALSDLKDMVWLRDQDPKHYVVQLVSVYRKRELEDFVARYGNHLHQDQLSYFKTLNRGRDMYVLLHGNYRGFSPAMDSLDDLPGSLQRNRPFVRTVGSVQDAM
ncbi:MAG: hypothetical protein GY703_00280 [Gammaproteobacteria bacterium]|nr:hypothetical protein [Gammaproteobacteria bacterium]